jgi:hypothetical protein
MWIALAVAVGSMAVVAVIGLLVRRRWPLPGGHSH